MRDVCILRITTSLQVILEDRRTNRVVESRSVFETIANNKSFANVSIILFMNKSDLLERKLHHFFLISLNLINDDVHRGSGEG